MLKKIAGRQKQLNLYYEFTLGTKKGGLIKQVTS